MKQKPEVVEPHENHIGFHEPEHRTRMESSETSSPQKIVKTSISVPGEVKPLPPDTVTVLVNSDTTATEAEPL